MKKNIPLDCGLARSKPGPKPVGEKAMTAAERKRKSRKIQAVEGAVEFSMKIHGARLEFVTMYAAALNQSRGAVIASLIDDSITRHKLILQRTAQLQNEHASDEHIARTILAMSSINGVDPEPSDDLVKKVAKSL